MFTLFPTNAAELIPLLRFVAEKTEAHSFSFDVGVFVGNAAELERNFSPGELKSILGAYNAEKKRLKAQGFALKVHEKCSFHLLNHFEEGEYYPYCAAELSAISGCLIGWNSVSILSDGTVLGCRRLPAVKAGKLPEQTFEEVMLGSPSLRAYRRHEYFEGCGECDFYMVCRGCPANVYSLTGNPLAANPLCYRHLIERQTDPVWRLAPVRRVHHTGLSISHHASLGEPGGWIGRHRRRRSAHEPHHKSSLAMAGHRTHLLQDVR